MKKFAVKILGIILKFFRLTRSAIERVIYYLEILRVYARGDECEKFKDCVLLARLKKTQPPASDRFIEYPWMLESITISEGKLLDIGSTISDKLYEILPKTIEIHTLNLNEKNVQNPNIKFKRGDIRKTDCPGDHFDCITCISTLEHIGVSGRYHSDEDPQGDLKAMQEIRRILKPGGILLVSVPYGAKDVLPINRLYNKERIGKLFEGLAIQEQIFRKYDKSWNAWIKTTEEEAAKTDMLKDSWYAIALIKAKKLQ